LRDEKEKLREEQGGSLVESWEKVVIIRQFGIDDQKNQKKSSEFFRDEMKHFLGSLGQRSEEGNLSVEMCSHEFFLKHALSHSSQNE